MKKMIAGLSCVIMMQTTFFPFIAQAQVLPMPGSGIISLPLLYINPVIAPKPLIGDFHYRRYDANTAELTGITYSDTTPAVSFTYDRLGRQAAVTDGLGSRVFAYTPSLQPNTETITGLYNKTLTRTYETTGVIGRSTGLTDGAGYSVTYGYDTTGRLNSIGSNVNGLTDTATYGYLANSDLLETLTNTSGQSTTYSYEPNRNLRTQVKNNFGVPIVSQYDYVYDELGRRSSVKNAGTAFGTAAFNHFAYNDRSELNDSSRYLGTDLLNLSSPVPGETRQYTFDPIGNRTNITEGTSAGSYVTNNLNQYTTETLPGGGTNTNTFDEDGNLTQIVGNKNITYTYDGENRLITAEPTTPILSDKKLNFLYDYQGRRVQKVISNYNGTAWITEATKNFIYDGWNVIEEQTLAQPSKYYVWGLDLSQSLQGAGGIGGLLAQVESTNSYAYLYDGNGDVGQLINNSTGTIEAHYEYDPFGNATTITGALANSNPFRFSTKYLDSEYNLYYYGYRYYDPESARWTSRDPIEEEGFKVVNTLVDTDTGGSLSPYIFVENNPIINIDPLGLDFIAVGTRHINNPIVGGLPGFWHMSLQFYEDKNLCLREGDKFKRNGTKYFLLKRTSRGSKLGAALSLVLSEKVELLNNPKDYYWVRFDKKNKRTERSASISELHINATPTAQLYVVIYADTAQNTDARQKWSKIIAAARKYPYISSPPGRRPTPTNWPNSAYGYSKNNSNTFTRVMARVINRNADQFGIYHIGSQVPSPVTNQPKQAPTHR